MAPLRPDNRAAAARLVDRARSGALDDLFQRHRVSLCTVFGSSVAGHAEAWGGAASDRPPAEAGDVDLAVSLEGDLFRFLDDVAAEVGPAEMDGLDLDRAGIPVVAEALSRCVPLYEAVEGEFARRQIAALLVKMDTDWMRRLDLDALAHGR